MIFGFHLIDRKPCKEFLVIPDRFSNTNLQNNLQNNVQNNYLQIQEIGNIERN